jgi:surface protein
MLSLQRNMYLKQETKTNKDMKRLLPLLLVMLAILMPTKVWAEDSAAEPYAVLSEDGLTVTFYYDNQKSARGGMDINNEFLANDSISAYSTATSAVIDASFANYHPTSTAYWFQKCSSLTSITGMENLKTDNVTNMRYMFSSCTSLTSLDLSSFNTANVTDMYCIFARCSSLTSIDVSGFNTANVTDMYCMFWRCSGLTSLDVSNLNTAKVTDMSGMFSGCTSLTSLDVTHFNTQNVTRMSEMFNECSGLTSLDLSVFKTDKVTNMARMFQFNPGLTTIYTSNEWSTASVTYGDYMFRDCTSLVGGAGTTYNSSHIDHAYAHIDGGTDNPGYFTDKNAISREMYYQNKFDTAEGLTIIGEGSFVDKGDEHGMIFRNFAGSSKRQNYLLLPEDLLSHSAETQQLTMSVWVNASNAGESDNYSWSPLLTAYTGAPSNGINTYPMWACQYRGILQVNCNGWCDYTDAQNLKGANTLYNGNNDWLADKKWHLYTVVLDGENAKVYFDGELKNEWDASISENGKENSQRGLFSDGYQLKYICLGGNQAWDWNDLDAGFEFDDIRFYNYALSQQDILALKNEYAIEIPDTVKTPTFEISYFNGDDLRMMTETDGAEIYYTMNGRMLQENDTDFGDGYLSSYSHWKVRGDNESHEVVRGSHNDSYCLKLASKKDDTFQSAQAYYTFDQFLKKGDYYTIRFKARSESGNGQMQFYCYNDTVANSLSAMDTLTIGKDWADYEATVKIANDSTNQFVLNFGALADTYYIDNVLFGPVISDTANQMRTRYVDPLRVERGVTIKAVAVKEGMMDSKPAVFDYFYDGWRYIPSVYEMGWMICKECTGDPNVPLDMVDKTKYQLEDIVAYLHERAKQEHIDDTQLMDYLYMMESMAKELDNMRRGFTIDGVSYHAVDSTQVELISLLTYPYHYANAITVAKDVHYNDIDFQVTSVAQNAFADSELAAIVWNPAVALKYEDVAVINNPNLLVYVNEASLAPENIQNIVVNGVAKTIILENAANGNFYCPQAFTAEAISYTREFRQETMVGVSRGWEGIALPFDVQTITHENSGLISPFSRGDNNKHFWLRRLSSNGLVPADKMEANVPYIIAMPNSTEYPEEYNLPGRVTFSSANVTVPVTETRTLALADSTIMMASTMQRLARSSRYYALNVGEVRGQYLEGSVFERDYREIRPFEAYTIHNNANSPAPRFVPINQVGNGETTGIESLTPSLSKGEGAWYDLNGQKLQLKPTQKGVYIRNGRKVIIK